MTKETTELALQRTKLANQRTFLSYMRTGFAIASVAGAFKKFWVVLFGITMILGSTIQYILLNQKLKDNKVLEHPLLDYMPVIYVILSLGTLYLQWKK